MLQNKQIGIMIIKFSSLNIFKSLTNPRIRLFSSEKPQGGFGIKLDEQAIKRKMKQIKQRETKVQKQSESKNEFLKNYRINKVKSQTKKFRQQTDSQTIFQIEDPTLDQKPTIMQIESFSEQAFEVDGFSYPPSIILTPNQLFLWELPSVKKMKVSHLKLIEIMNPPPIYIILGVKKVEDVPNQIREYLSKLEVNYDIIPMFEAISNYNTYSNDELPLIAFLNNAE